jgi:hypothetical protein
MWVSLSSVGFLYGAVLTFMLRVTGMERLLLAAMAMFILVTVMAPIFHCSILLTMAVIHRKANGSAGVRFNVWDVLLILAGLPVPWILGFLIEEYAPRSV